MSIALRRALALTVIAALIAIGLVAAFTALGRPHQSRAGAQAPQTKAKAPPPRVQLPHCRPATTTVRFSAKTRQRLVSLTFDDGPGPATGKILDELRRYGQKATFFVLGANVSQHRDLIRRIIREGHSIGNHSWDHANLANADRQRTITELNDTSATIRAASGRPPCTVRLPYGATNAPTQATAKAAKLQAVHWNVDTRDWAGNPPAQMAQEVLSNLRPGAIILAHDQNAHSANTVAALKLILPALKQRRYRSVRVEDLLHLYRYPGRQRPPRRR